MFIFLCVNLVYTNLENVKFWVILGALHFGTEGVLTRVILIAICHILYLSLYHVEKSLWSLMFVGTTTVLVYLLFSKWFGFSTRRNWWSLMSYNYNYLKVGGTRRQKASVAYASYSLTSFTWLVTLLCRLLWFGVASRKCHVQALPKRSQQSCSWIS
jgi:hypothetical protein